ncbi:hypothetical protein MTYM_00868 [Methylococcales bacterium]|nr:hypothetical protein MTYM_00868 [Methylococcales bacterium]
MDEINIDFVALCLFFDFFVSFSRHFDFHESKILVLQ